MLALSSENNSGWDPTQMAPEPTTGLAATSRAWPRRMAACIHVRSAHLNSMSMLLSGARPTQARITFSSMARCLESALMTGVPCVRGGAGGTERSKAGSLWGRTFRLLGWDQRRMGWRERAMGPNFAFARHCLFGTLLRAWCQTSSAECKVERGALQAVPLSKMLGDSWGGQLTLEFSWGPNRALVR